MTLVDAEGQALTGASRYRLHFDKAELPRARVLVGDAVRQRRVPVPNPLNRCAIGDRDPLRYNADGSLELHVQHDSPGTDQESNWLPAPSGPFNLTMRLYYTKPAVLDGTWAPHGVQRMA